MQYVPIVVGPSNIDIGWPTHLIFTSSAVLVHRKAKRLPDARKAYVSGCSVLDYVRLRSQLH